MTPLVDYCDFNDKITGARCRKCGFLLPMDFPDVPIRECKSACQYLGPPIKREGVTEKVKCTCPNNQNGYTEQWHIAHQCSAPEHQRHNGKPGQCLPTFEGPFDEDHQPEAYILKLCYGCEVNPEFQATLKKGDLLDAN